MMAIRFLNLRYVGRWKVLEQDKQSHIFDHDLSTKKMKNNTNFKTLRQ